MKPDHVAKNEALERRWDRIGLGVRCAYNPRRTEILHHYMLAGRRLAHLHPGCEARIQRRTLDLLLHTAADRALPWHWRAACLEHTAWPLARLISLLGGHSGGGGGPGALLEQRVRRVGEELGLPPGRAASIEGDAWGPPAGGSPPAEGSR